ncbi:cytochrome P450 monooxygenase-like protein [Calycina marina]|uniref:Cytochrome P450 monooxygenase-like protein n=1 Tax=Calycina marina TaxID=1763456 RepID=A0A9P7ZAF0_9HELO|nr:cytochrome P450 monooxygenase-like protein [Calycina marina]
MSSIPFKALAVAPALSSYVLVQHRPDALLFSRPTYLGTFVQLYFLEFIVWAIYKVMLYPRFFSPMRHLPKPPGGSFWNGHWKQITENATGQPMIEWVKNVPNNGIIRYNGMFNSERLLITNPKALSEVLVTKNYNFVKPGYVTTFLGRLLGVGVLLAEGDEHKQQRKNLMPAFAFRHIKDLYPVFWNKSRDAVVQMTEDFEKAAVKNIEQDAQSQWTFEVGEWASRATLDIIGIAALGEDFGSIADPDTELSKTYRIVFKPSKAAQLLGLLGLLLPSWLVTRLPIKRNGEIEAAAAIIRATCRQRIRDKRNKLEKNALTDVDILSIALKSGGFSEENLVDQMMTFLAAGHETTATAMTWAIYMLCLNPDIQTRLRNEIREKLPGLEEQCDITSQIIDNMPYLNAVCNEVLRYYPPVPLTIRDTCRDTTIVGEFVPKGTRVILCPWAINKDTAQWGPDAAKFNPDRWLSSPASANGGAPNNYSFLTFLHGPRSCIGQKFAQAEFACLLAAWVGRFEYTLKNEEEYDERNILIKGGVTAKPEKGLFVKAKVVAGW